MKKTYQQPSMMMVSLRATTMICASYGINSANGIEYGGVDNSGILDPSAKGITDISLWDNEW